jgi:hypothetical protein
MFDLAELVTLLQTAGFKAALDSGKEPSLANQSDEGRIQVGYDSVESQGELSDGISSDSCLKLSQDLAFVFYLQYTCKLEEFPEFYTTLYSLVNSWIPTPVIPDGDYTATFMDKGGKKGISNGRIWWVDYWQIDFPRVQAKFPG